MLRSLAIRGEKLLWATWLSSYPRVKQLIISEDLFVTNFCCLFSQDSVKASPVSSVSSGLRVLSSPQGDKLFLILFH